MVGNMLLTQTRGHFTGPITVLVTDDGARTIHAEPYVTGEFALRAKVIVHGGCLQDASNGAVSGYYQLGARHHCKTK